MTEYLSACPKTSLVSEGEQSLHRRREYPGYVHGQLERWIVVPFLEVNYRLSSHAHQPGEVVLGQVVSGSEFPEFRLQYHCSPPDLSLVIRQREAEDQHLQGKEERKTNGVSHRRRRREKRPVDED